jgi:glycosyltransferase involved in cell wall biosynthesis
MRILHLSTSFPSDIKDASGRFVYRLIQAEKELGMKCLALAPSSTNPSCWPNDVEAHRFRYAPRPWQLLCHRPGGIPEAISKNPFLYALLPFFLAGMTLSLVRLAKTCHVIHANWSICGAVAAFSKKIHNRPVITTVHGSDHYLAQKNKPYNLIHKMAVRGSSHVAGVSKAITEDLKDFFPRYKDRIHFIPNGVSNTFYKVNPHERPGGHFIKFLYVGSLIPLKGLDVLLKALAYLSPDAQWSLTLAGDGPEMETLKLLAKDLNLDSRVIFLGRVAPRSVPELMANHHIFVLPSHREGRPSVILEAMAAAMPVVATDIDGTRELVQNGITGWLFRPGDEKGLASILSPIIEARGHFHEKGLQARNWMMDNELTWADTARAYKKLYEESIKAKKY